MDEKIGLADREIHSSRFFSFPPEKVFRAFSDPALLKLWWGPNGFTNTIQKFDLRPGGAWNLIMHGPNGAEYSNTSVFVEVIPQKRVVFQHIEPVHGFQMSMDFAEMEGGTRLDWCMRFDSLEECKKVNSFIVQANEQNFDRPGKVLSEIG